MQILGVELRDDLLVIPTSEAENKQSKSLLRSEFSFSSYGVTVQVRFNTLEIFDLLLSYLPPGWKYCSSVEVDIEYFFVTEILSSCKKYIVFRNREKLIEAATLEAALDAFDSDLRLRIAVAVQDKLFVHAGVVGWKDKAIVIPGRSFSGKTTLVAALIKAGATYYSDEYAVFDTEGLVHPYSRPLSVRQAQGARAKRCPVEELGGVAGTDPLPVGLIAYTQYEPGAQWKPSQMSPGQAALALLDNTVVARLRPDFVLPIVSTVVCDVLSLEGKRGEVDETATALLRQI